MKTKITLLAFMLLTMFVFNTCKKEVEVANLTGTITDEVNSSRTIADATITIGSETATSGTNGAFSITDMQPGSYTITVSKNGYNTISQPITLVAGDNVQTFRMQQLLNILPQSLSFQNSESEKTLQLTYIGSGTISFSIVSSENWLTVTPTEGVISNSILFLKVKVNRSGLAFGSYNATLALNSQNINPLQVSVAMTFSESAKLATLTTTNISGITTNSALSGGNISNDGGASITSRGVCWSTSSNPTINNNVSSDGTGTGSYTSQITGLAMNTSYFVRAYATNSVGTAYGTEMSFTTPATSMPTVITVSPSNITANGATSGGNVTADGGSTVTARGICWSTTENPTISNSHTTEGSGTGNFASQMTGLSALTTYHVRAYATNANGTNYGNNLTFTTLQGLPISGFVAYYPFNGNANDESGNGNNGTVNGATLTTDRKGVANNLNAAKKLITMYNKFVKY